MGMLRPLGIALAISALAVLPAGAVEKGGLLTAPRLDGVINRGAGRSVALTFDACPRPPGAVSFDPKIIEILRREKVPATIFVSGQWAVKHAAVLKDLAADPLFEIGNHGHNHTHMAGQPAAVNRRELARAQEAILRITGRAPKVWRPPYGEVDTTAVSAAASLGLHTINFSLASGDPDARLSARRIARAVVENAKPGSIVVMHVNGNGLRTSEALPEMIEGLRRRGFALVQAGTFVAQAPPVASAVSR